jgi:serine/threonine protein phosphatase PrpC
MRLLVPWQKTSVLGYMTLLMSLKLFLCRIKFKEDIIVSTPDVSLVELGPDVEFLILATDGLWDYMKRSIQVSFIFM